MTQNAPQLTSLVITILGSAVILLLFAISVALPLHGRTRPGSSGHRKSEDDIGHEDVQPDGFIDSFSKEIEEAGGGRDSDRQIQRFDRSKIDGRDHGSNGKGPAGED